MIRFIASAFLAVTFCFAQSDPSAPPNGQIIRRVTCAANPAQSYALYLPKSYDPSKKWATLFVFEPSARGPLPVGIMQSAAEQFGYIVISSNNSRNGPLQPQIEAADAMWRDAHTRFSIDPKRVYFAGFSGGARVAIAFAVACKGCAAGVMASGAGFPTGVEPKNAPGFALFSAIGREDFNYPEILQLEPKLQQANYTYHVRRFDGVHEWAPADVWQEVFAWFNLQAMKIGTIPKDQVFISSSYQRAFDNASGLLASGKQYEALRAYKQAVADFEGLTTTTDARRQVAELQDTKAVKEALKQERQEAETQARMAEPINARIEELAQNTLSRETILAELRAEFQNVRRRAKDEKDRQQMIAKRVLTQEFVHAYEAGAHLLDAKQYADALVLYEAIVTNATKAPGAHLQRARAYAALGNKTKAFEELRAAIQDGVSDPEDLNQPELSRFHNDPAFQTLLGSLHPTTAQ